MEGKDEAQGQTVTFISMCVSKLCKIELLTAGSLLLEMADTSPHCIFDVVMLWNIFNYDCGQKYKQQKFMTQGLVGF